ncbi:MAG: hypothetical protein LBM73_00340 [Candidatus Nomurabacteria bacterium]|jgi:hypothetical protein|nr:hypothetical protein [Candidatus Nomurabacteria bacterium]
MPESEFVIGSPGFACPTDKLKCFPEVSKRIKPLRRMLGKLGINERKTGGLWGGDIGEYVDDLCRFQAAVDQFGSSIPILNWHSYDSQIGLESLILRINKHQAKGAESLAGRDYVLSFYFGTLSRLSYPDPSIQAAYYYDSPAFKKFAGRKIGLGGFRFNDDLPFDGLTVPEVIQRMNNDDGITNFVLKPTIPKYIPCPVFLEIPQQASPKQISDIIGSQFFGNIGCCDGDHGLKLHNSNSVLVQERIKMEYEYRFFVVNHRLVAGAGCIGSNTPLDNSGIKFHPQVARLDNGEDRIDEWRPEIQGKMLNTARQIIEITQVTEPDVGCYALDLAIDADTGEPIMVERNEFCNAGLYGADPHFLVDAVWRAALQSRWQTNQFSVDLKKQSKPPEKYQDRVMPYIIAHMRRLTPEEESALGPLNHPDVSFI